MQKRGPEECIGNYSPQLVRGCGYWFWHYFGIITKGKHEPFAFKNGKSSALCILVQVFNDPQTSRNAGAVRKAFLGIVYGDI